MTESFLENMNYTVGVLLDADDISSEILALCIPKNVPCTLLFKT